LLGLILWLPTTPPFPRTPPLPPPEGGGVAGGRGRGGSRVQGRKAWTKFGAFSPGGEGRGEGEPSSPPFQFSGFAGSSFQIVDWKTFGVFLRLHRIKSRAVEQGFRL